MLALTGSYRGHRQLADAHCDGLSLYALMVLAVVGLNKVTPNGFIPSEDSGVVIGFDVPDGASWSAEEVTRRR